MARFLTQHAQERMEERGISVWDIEEAIDYGIINKSKSTEKSKLIEYGDLRVVLSNDGAVITSFRNDNHDLKVEIDTLNSEADYLASQFRYYFDLASSNYSSGFGAEAKYYSQIGHSIKDSCVVLNIYINNLRKLARSY
ncbi:TPA: DUF4258 domain-containing protein [Vibrio parahaemolyticus]